MRKLGIRLSYVGHTSALWTAFSCNAYHFATSRLIGTGGCIACRTLLNPLCPIHVYTVSKGNDSPIS